MDEDTVRVTAGTATLDGNLTIPKGAQAVVLFAHGSGSSRHSSRNRLVARLLNEAKLATLLVDLLTPDVPCSLRKAGRDNINMPTSKRQPISCTG